MMHSADVSPSASTLSSPEPSRVHSGYLLSAVSTWWVSDGLGCVIVRCDLATKGTWCVGRAKERDGEADGCWGARERGREEGREWEGAMGIGRLGTVLAVLSDEERRGTTVCDCVWVRGLLGAWSLVLVLVLVSGLRFTVHGSRFTVHGSRSTIHDLWLTGFGLWLAVYGFWFSVLDLLSRVGLLSRVFCLWSSGFWVRSIWKIPHWFCRLGISASALLVEWSPACFTVVLYRTLGRQEKQAGSKICNTR
jgi:hypothetical protein